MKIFNETEEKVIAKEYTYNDTRRLNRNSQDNFEENTHHFTE
jgi:hypothetical protein